MILNEVEASTDRLCGLEPPAALEEMLDVEAAVDWLEASGVNVTQHRGAMPNDETRAQIVAAGTPPPAPHIAPLRFSATSTPAGWIVSSADGVVIAQLGANQFRAEALAADLNRTLDSHRERATEDAARFARGLLGRLSGQP
jgi:hypothetical protein